MLRRNLGYKLLALAAAIVIWLYASENESHIISQSLVLPLEVRKVEPAYVVTSKPPTVKVLLEGPRAHVDSIAADPDCAIAYVNIRGKTSGRHIVPVIVSLPAGFSGLVGTIVQPRSISITLEKTAERTLDIDSQFTSPPPMGFRFGVPQILPSKAVIRGPTGKVDSVSQLAAAIDLDQPGMQSIDGDYAIVALDKGGMQIAGLEITPGRTHVHMELREAPVNRVVFVGVNAIGQPPFPYRVETIRIEPSTVTLAGRPEEVAKVGSIRTEPIQLANRTKTFTQKARIIAPEGLSLPDGGYVQVTVKIVSSPDTENKSPTTGTSD